MIAAACFLTYFSSCSRVTLEAEPGVWAGVRGVEADGVDAAVAPLPPESGVCACVQGNTPEYVGCLLACALKCA